MPRPKSATLTDAELRLMNLLWRDGPLTVTALTAALPKKERLAYSSVLTTMRILEQKGYVAHEQAGRAFLYRPLVEREQAQRGALKHLLARLFEGNPRLLMQNLAEVDQLDEADRAALRRIAKQLGPERKS